ncbi:hypothetical protein [Reyranella sp. CPCC 100927]|uniref:hypothetical protein n=1 Tax=Reyranella sp. CPCC 100927 TaxID=2599616 RepID=UPI0011B7782B|nr:hypothetical protein [Reyranella sp. CPCC 100927]TWT02002.1 hypothetical protein FQU96_30960 [Reyranella sp. CPCC 100927]
MLVEYHPSPLHNHKPCGKWAEIQKAPNSPGRPDLEWLCKKLDYPSFATAAIGKLVGPGLARARLHMQRYLGGTGRDMDQSDYLAKVLRQDKGVLTAIAENIPKGMKTGVFAGNFFLDQGAYAMEEARLAWGGIYRLDFEVNFTAGTLRVWFMDRYEWHPYYPGLYTLCKEDLEDGPRETNCVHAAFVEMKSRGAADYWMFGAATVPASLLPDKIGVVPKVSNW